MQQPVRDNSKQPGGRRQKIGHRSYEQMIKLLKQSTNGLLWGLLLVGPSPGFQMGIERRQQTLQQGSPLRILMEKHLLGSNRKNNQLTFVEEIRQEKLTRQKIAAQLSNINGLSLKRVIHREGSLFSTNSIGIEINFNLGKMQALK